MLGFGVGFARFPRFGSKDISNFQNDKSKNDETDHDIICCLIILGIGYPAALVASSRLELPILFLIQATSHTSHTSHIKKELKRIKRVCRGARFDRLRVPRCTRWVPKFMIF